MFQGIKDLEYETYKGVNYYLCKSCNLIFQYPLPDKNLLPNFYPEEYRNFKIQKSDLFSSLKNIQFQELASKISKHIAKDSKILEVGFGNGQLLIALKQQGYEKLYGSDFTDRAFKSLKNEGIELAVNNIEEEFPFNETFDAIIMNNVIEHFLNPVQVLKKCKNSLSKNGKIILITPNSNAIEFSIFKKYWAGFHAPRHIFIFNKNNILLLGKNLGFSKVNIESITDPGQWSISVQNLLQEKDLTKTKLKNGMAWYTLPLSILCAPLATLQNFLDKSTSMMCVLENEA